MPTEYTSYHPIVPIGTIENGLWGTAIDTYFNSSYKNMVFFFAKRKKISAAELREICNDWESTRKLTNKPNK
jgi:predicted transcriptional regulator